LLPEAAVSQPTTDDDLFAGLPKNANDVYAAQAKTADDALLPRPAQPSIIRGWLPAKSLSIVFSAPGVGKTNLLIDAAVSVAMGESCWPGLPGKFSHAGFETTPSPVLLVDVDNGTDLMAERIAAHVRGHDAPAGIPLSYLSFPIPPVCAARGLRQLTTYAQSIGAGLIVLDNLLRVAGVKDENSSEIDVAMGNLRQLAEDTGAAVVIVHHQRKMSGVKGEREGESLRGHSSIEGALDAAYLVKRNYENDPPILTLTNTKWRRKAADPFSLIWTYNPEPDGETLHAARFWRVALKDKKAEAYDMLRVLVLAALEQGGSMNTTQIVATVGHNKGEVVKLLGDLNRQRAVVVETGARGAKVYRLP
jgi:hypothetical protein